MVVPEHTDDDFRLLALCEGREAPQIAKPNGGFDFFAGVGALMALAADEARRAGMTDEQAVSFEAPEAAADGTDDTADEGTDYGADDAVAAIEAAFGTLPASPSERAFAGRQRAHTGNAGQYDEPLAEWFAPPSSFADWHLAPSPTPVAACHDHLPSP